MGRVKYGIIGKIGDVDNTASQHLGAYIFEFPADDMLRIKQRMELKMLACLLENMGQQFILREHPIWFRKGGIMRCVI